MAAPPVRYRVALDLTPEQYDQMQALVQRARKARYSFAGTTQLDGVLRLGLSLGLSELAKLMDALDRDTQKSKRKTRRSR